MMIFEFEIITHTVKNDPKYACYAESWKQRDGKFEVILKLFSESFMFQKI